MTLLSLTRGAGILRRFCWDKGREAEGDDMPRITTGIYYHPGSDEPEFGDWIESPDYCARCWPAAKRKHEKINAAAGDGVVGPPFAGPTVVSDVGTPHPNYLGMDYCCDKCGRTLTELDNDRDHWREMTASEARKYWRTTGSTP